MSPVIADAVFWIAVACCVVAQAALLRSQLAASVAPAATAGAEPATTRRAAEVVWAIVPAVALALVLGWTWRTLHPSPVATTAGAVPALVADAAQASHS